MVRRIDVDSLLQGVQPYDRLVEVNGVRQKASRLAKMVADSSSLQLVFQRPIMKAVR